MCVCVSDGHLQGPLDRSTLRGVKDLVALIVHQKLGLFNEAAPSIRLVEPVHQPERPTVSLSKSEERDRHSRERK